MNRRTASLAQARLCLARAEADRTRRAYWLAEAVKWQQRADEEFAGGSGTGQRGEGGEKAD